MSTATWGPRLRDALAGALLLGEFLWLLARFSTATLPQSDESWVWLVRQAKYLPQIGLAVLTILLLFRRVDEAEPSRHAALAYRPPAKLVVLLLAQIGAFALLALTTARVFEGQSAGVGHPLLLLAAWGACALASALFGVLLFLTLRTCLQMLSRRAGVLAAGCLLGLTAWLAGQFAENQLSEPLRTPTLWLADKLFGLFEHNYILDPVEFIIGTADYRVRIAPSCSGFEGMGLMAVFSISYAWVFRARLRFPQLLLLPLIGIVSVWLLNVVRIVALVLIGTHVSPELADGGFHSLAGTFSFCLTALGLVVLSNRMHFFSAIEERERGTQEHDGTAAYLTPFLIIVALGMVMTALGKSGSVLLPLKVLAPACALWLFRRDYPIALQKSWLTPLALGVLAFGCWLWIPRVAGAGGALSAADQGSAWLVLRIAGSVCVVPLVEELAFRGYLMRRLTAVEFENVTAGQVSLLAWAISALLFGLLHEHWLAATLSGALYGFAYMRRGQLFDCVVAHACTNLLLAVFALCTGDKSLL